MVKRPNKRRDLRITWNSNASWTNSGYASFTRDLLNRLTKDGWPIAEIAFYGLQGYNIDYNGRKVYPQMADPYGGDAMSNHSVDFKANVVFAMQDLQTIHPSFLDEINRKGMKFIPYLPIDQSPPIPSILTNLNYAHKIITFSKFGQNELEKAGYMSTMIPEGIDINIFKPGDKSFRKEAGLPEDAFIFGMIGANKENPPRKGYQEALEAFQLFSKNHPEAIIYFHTQQIAPGNFPIMDYAKYLKIEKKVFGLDQYSATFRAGPEMIVKELNSFDVLLHPSMTEGFGLLPVEAQACGIPAIVNRCHSQPELVKEGVTGEICETGKGWWRSLGGYIYPADVDSLHQKMENLYTKLKDLEQKKEIARAAREHVANNFNIDALVKDRWIPYLENLQDEILGKIDTKTEK